MPGLNPLEALPVGLFVALEWELEIAWALFLPEWTKNIHGIAKKWAALTIQ